MTLLTAGALTASNVCTNDAWPGGVIFISTLVPGSDRFQLTNLLGFS